MITGLVPSGTLFEKTVLNYKAASETSPVLVWGAMWPRKWVPQIFCMPLACKFPFL